MALNPRYKYYAISATSVAVILMCIYYLLGGMQEYHVQQGGSVDYDVVGIQMKGRYRADTARTVFEHFRNKLTSAEWEGELVEIAYPADEKGQIHQFFGVLLTGMVTEIEGNYQLKRIKAPATLQVALEMHPLVRPAREKVEAKIYDFAQERGLELEGYFLQRYFPDNSVIIEAFIKEN